MTDTKTPGPPITYKQAHALLRESLRIFGVELINNLCKRRLMADDWGARLMREPGYRPSTCPMDAIDLDPITTKLLDLLRIEDDNQ